MKICLLISGLPRYVEKSYPNILKSLIEPNDPDIFIHTWNDLDSTLNYPIIDFYKPKAIKSENQKTWINSNMNLDRMMASHARSYARDKFVEMLYSSWYSIQQSNLLKEQYRLENNISYDFAIRARFDIHYSKAVVCKNYDSNILHISNKWLPDKEMTDDRFAFGSNRLINSYCSGFNLLDFVHEMRHKKDGIFCGETLVYEMCRMFGMESRQISDLTCNNVSHMVSQGLI